MPLPIPQLDDRTFDQLVAEGRALIPRYTSVWTDFNTSDPGITLLELFAFLAETSIFQLDQLPPEAIERFLRLGGIAREPGEPLAGAVVRALEAAAATPRAVTEAELDELAVSTSSAAHPPAARAKVAVAEVYCEPHEDPPGGGSDAVLVTVVAGTDPHPPRVAPGPFALDDHVYRELRQRVPLGTRVHVVPPDWVAVSIAVTVVRRPGATLTAADVEAAATAFLDPVAGGADGSGWPFGRAVYRSELFQLLEGLPQVDHVASLTLSPPTGPAVLVPEGIVMTSPSALVAAPAHVVAAVEDPR